MPHYCEDMEKIDGKKPPGTGFFQIYGQTPSFCLHQGQGLFLVVAGIVTKKF